MIIFDIKNDYDYKYLLALINSRLMSFWFDKFQRKIFPQFKVKEMAIFSIRAIDFINHTEKKLHDDLVALVDIMLELNKKLQKARGAEKSQIQRQIEKTDREIDDLAHKLYNIN